jgi:nucleoside 2-deoxyribosyltransferase
VRKEMGKDFKIYCAHPISGLSYEEVLGYYNSIKEKLSGFGYHVLNPMTGKDALRTEKKLRTSGYRTPVSTNHAITERDRWMVGQSDVVYINLCKSKEVSIGCMAELAWAHQLGKHTVTVLEKDNIHQHCFVLEMSDIVFETEKEAEEYLKILVE